jgi:hypothetical protein
MENTNENKFYHPYAKELFHPAPNITPMFPVSKWYAEKHQMIPDIINFGRVNADVVLAKYHDKVLHMQKGVDFDFKSKGKTNLPIYNPEKYLRRFNGRHETLIHAHVEIEDGVYIFLNDGLTSSQYLSSSCNAYLFYKQGIHDISKIQEFIASGKHNHVTNGTLGILVNSNNGLQLRQFSIPNPEIDFDINYNEDFKEVHEVIYSNLTEYTGKGLVILHGKPGTGKTTYIRWLINNLNKNKIYIPPNFVNELSNPGLLTFLLNHPNSIVFVEDAENVFMKREGQNNQAVSNVLNFTDGLLGDCLNLQVVATFNTPLKNIDEALLRKGRLIARYEFTELEFDRAEKLADKMRIFLTDADGDKLTLADIYNSKNKW